MPHSGENGILSSFSPHMQNRVDTVRIDLEVVGEAIFELSDKTSLASDSIVSRFIKKAAASICCALCLLFRDSLVLPIPNA